MKTKTKKTVAKKMSMSKAAMKTPTKEAGPSLFEKDILRVIRQNKRLGSSRVDIIEKTAIDGMTLTVIMRKLKLEGSIRSEGVTRNTRWFPVGAA